MAPPVPLVNNYGTSGDGLDFWDSVKNNTRYGFDWLTGNRNAQRNRSLSNWRDMSPTQQQTRLNDFNTTSGWGGQTRTYAATPYAPFANLAPDASQAQMIQAEVAANPSQYTWDNKIGGYTPVTGAATPDRGWNWFSTPEQTGVLETGAAIGKGFGELMGAWNGLQQNNLMEDQFNYQRDFANRNLANQASLVNQRLEDRYRARIGATGNGGAGYNYAKPTYVDGSPV